MPWQINTEHAPGTRQVADTHNSPARLDAVAAYPEPKSESASVVAQLCKGYKHLFYSARRKPAATVLDVDADSIGRRVGTQTNLAMIASEFEGVLQQVSDRRQEQVSVAANGKLFVNLGYAESTLPYPRFQGRGQFNFSDEVGEREDVMLAAQAGCYSNLSEGTIDQVPHPDQTLVEQGTSGAGKAYVARPEGSKRKSGGTQQVSQFMGENPEALA